MESLHRLFLFHRLLASSRRAVSKSRLLEELECSPATFKRLLNVLRDQYNFPIIYDRHAGGYRYSDCSPEIVPGPWFSESQIFALLISVNLLSDARKNALSPLLTPVQRELSNLLAPQKNNMAAIADKVRVLPIAGQIVNEDIFQTALTSCMKECQLQISYEDIEQRRTRRLVSPQRLTFYRDNWYLEAWCHQRDDYRTFLLSAIHTAENLPEPALQVAREELDRYTAESYGIFSGKATGIATLRFSPKIANRIKGAIWHPGQIQYTNKLGGIDMQIPYSDSRELVRDVLRWGSDVLVLSPETLRSTINQELKRAQAQYTTLSTGSPCEPHT